MTTADPIVWYIVLLGLGILLLLAVVEPVAHAFMGVLPGNRTRAENFALAIALLYLWLRHGSDDENDAH